MSKVIPLTLETPGQLLLSLQNMDMDEIADMVVLVKHKDGDTGISHNTMPTERLYYLGGMLQSYATLG